MVLTEIALLRIDCLNQNPRLSRGFISTSEDTNIQPSKTSFCSAFEVIYHEIH